MLETLAALNIPLSDITSGGIVTIIVLSILRGWIVPRKVLEDEKSISASWRAAWEAERAARDRLQESINLMIQTGQSTQKILQSLPPISDSEQREEEQ